MIVHGSFNENLVRIAHANVSNVERSGRSNLIHRSKDAGQVGCRIFHSEQLERIANALDAIPSVNKVERGSGRINSGDRSDDAGR
jgi:hypothetical protein